MAAVVPVALSGLVAFLLALPRVARGEDEEGAPPNESVLTAAVLTHSPTLDGRLSVGEWSEDPACIARLDRADQCLAARRANWKGIEDASAVVRVAADARALYLAVSVTDDQPFHPGEPWWHGDSLEVFLNTDLSDDGPGAEDAFSDDDWQIFFMPSNATLHWGVAYHGQKARFDDAGLSGVRTAFTWRLGGSYDLEIRIPLENFPGLAGGGARRIGFALALNDVDRLVPGPDAQAAPTPEPGTYLSWNGGFNLWRRPGHFGVLVLPPRAAPPSGEARGVPESPALWIALAAAALLVALVTGGPGSRRLARSGPRPKAVMLVLDVFLGGWIALHTSCAEQTAREGVRARLAAAVEEANLVASEAAEVGALDARDPSARARVLARLLAGDRVACMPPVLDQRYVALGTAWEDVDVRGPLDYRIRLKPGAREDWPLAAPVDATALLLRFEPDRAEGKPERREADVDVADALGRVLATSADGPVQDLRVEGALDPGAGGRTVRLALRPPARLTRLVYEHASDAPPVVLTSVVAVREDGTQATLLLPGWTEGHVPIIARPDPAGPVGGGPAPAGSSGTGLGVSLLPGASRTVALPDLPGADRLWLALTAERAYPQTRHGLPVAKVTIAFDGGPPQTLEVRNGSDIDDARLIHAVKHPADMRSRVAFRWEEGGVTHHLDLLPVGLDPRRKPVSVEFQNLGGAGIVRIAAATIAKRATDVGGGRLAVFTDAVEGRDTVQLRDPKAFAETSRAHPGEAERRSATVGPADRRTVVALSLPLPEAVQEAADRRETAILTCLVLAAFLLVLLAVDAFEAFRRLSLRLVSGVLVAALLPVGVTIALVDRSNAARLESERAGRVTGWLAASRTALTSEARKAQVGAQGLVEAVSSGRERSDATALREAVRIYRRDAIVGGAAAGVVVRGRDLPTLTVEPETQGDRIAGAAFLADRADAPGLYASPWDGLLLVGTARSPGEDWRKVILGTRVDDDFVAERVAAALPDPEAEVVVLTRSGEPAGASGEGAQALAAALSARLAELAAGLGARETTVLNRVATGAGPRLAVLTALPAAGSPDTPAAWLAVGIPRAALDADLAALREELIGLGLAAAVLVACVAAVLARRIAGPVRDLVTVTEAVRRGEFDVEVPPPGTDEVGDLAVAFDQMRRDLKHRMGDLAFLRRAQEQVSASLELAGTSEASLALFRERWEPEVALLLLALAPTGPVTVRAEAGRKNAASDRPIAAEPEGWLRAALAATEPVAVEDAAADPRVKAEGAAGNRLVEACNAWLAVPLRTGGEVQGVAVLAWAGATGLPRAEERALLTPLAGVVALAVHNARLYRLAALDEATGLPGATAFESALRRDVDTALAGGPAAVVLRVGLDGVERTLRRSVESGRTLLRAAADALRASLAGRIQVGRLREEEFAVRLPGATREEAVKVADEVRERIAAVEIRPEDGGDPIRTGVSVGIARCPEDAKSVEFLLDAAARAVAAARRDGGDRVEDVHRVDAGLVEIPPFEDGAVFRTERMVRVVETARRVARTDSIVLLTGETGSGKEVIADLIHRRSARADKAFVKVNCAAFPETLLESELFGHERGAFTGADRRREGRFELADGGTLFLDEVGEMALTAQVKLLRVLSEGQFTRLGGTRPVDVDVRIVAATNQDLEEAVRAGRFREDLYYRLNVLRIEVPPLRERREEIPALVDHFLAEARRRIGRGPARLSPEAMDALYRHSWPGNVRELRNVLERCAVMCEAEVAGPEHLRIDPPRPGAGAAAPPVAAPMDDLNERQRALLQHLSAHGRCTNREFHEMTATSPRTGLRDLQDLIDRGLIVREGKRRGAVYRLP